MDTLNILIKPSSLCNMRCKYCFYSDISGHRALEGDGIMTADTLERLVREAFSVPARRVVFGFQGGEPTMAGLRFFRRFSELLASYKPPDVSVLCTIQTNGILLDEEWSVYFRENGFLVGLSLDGTAPLHDMNRLDSGGKGTFRQVSRSYDLLTRNGADTNILCVVTNQSARRAQAMYNGLKSTGCRYLQFIPCLPPIEKDGASDYSPSPEKYAVFLKTLFDLWYNDWARGDYVSIRLFDDYVHILTGRRPGSCASAGQCGQYIVAESDGGVYPCDFYTTDEWRLGNINSTALSELLVCDKGNAFIEKSAERPAGCDTCEYQNICRGGCMRDRRGESGRMYNYYCKAFSDFFAYAMPRLTEIASREREFEMRGQRS